MTTETKQQLWGYIYAYAAESSSVAESLEAGNYKAANHYSRKMKETEQKIRDILDAETEVEPECKPCPDCNGTGYLPSQQEYCQPICTTCNCVGVVIDALTE